jgi:signal transduction histidine kinase
MAVEPNDSATWLLNLPSTLWQRRAGYCVAVALLAGFAISAPLAAIALPRVDGFIPVVEALMFLTDFITAVLLYSQFSIYRSKALLVLSSGYLFTALIIIPHLASYPGVFMPSGLFGATVDTTAWLYYFWHIGFPTTLLVYAYFRRWKRKQSISEAAASSAIAWIIFLVISLVLVVSWFAFRGTGYLPHLFADRTRSAPFLFYIGGIAFFIALAGTVVLWTIQRSVLDLWLFVVGVAATSEVGLITVGTARFTVGFYVGRVFALVTSTTVLVVLVSESTRLYKRLARSNAMLQRERNNKLMNVGATAAAIAHELKQPLAAMVANADATLEFLEKVPPDLLQAKEALNDIVADGHHTSDALDGIRTLFRNVNEGREPVDLNEIAREVLHSMRGELNDGGITAQPELASEIPLIQGNRGQLQQVIFNLTHNAAEAMAGTTDRSRVLRLITQRGDRNRIVVAVQDTGPGIDPKRLDAIFDAFVTTKPQGTGLGLAICRVIIDRHGGELTAYSDGKNGALFQFSLPIEPADKGAVRA